MVQSGSSNLVKQMKIILQEQIEPFKPEVKYTPSVPAKIGTRECALDAELIEAAGKLVERANACLVEQGKTLTRLIVVVELDDHLTIKASVQ